MKIYLLRVLKQKKCSKGLHSYNNESDGFVTIRDTFTTEVKKNGWLRFNFSTLISLTYLILL